MFTRSRALIATAVLASGMGVLTLAPTGTASAAAPSYTDTSTVQTGVVVKDAKGKVISSTISPAKTVAAGTTVSGGSTSTQAQALAAAQAAAASGCAQVWAQTTKHRTYFGMDAFKVYTYRLTKNFCWNDSQNRIYSIGVVAGFTYRTSFTVLGSVTDNTDFFYNGGVAHRSVRGQILKNCGIPTGGLACINEWNPRIQMDVFDYGGWWYTILST